MTGLAILQLTCLACGKPFATEKAGRGRYPRFCSPVCRRSRRLAQAKIHWAEKGRHAIRAPANRRPISKVCEVCKNPFETTNRATVCCGMVCGQVLASRRGSATRTAKSIARRQRQCEHCKGAFLARHPSGKARAGKVNEGRFCSRRCAAAVRKAASSTPLFELFFGEGVRSR